MPPPVRRIAVDRDPHVAAPTAPGANGDPQAQASLGAARRRMVSPEHIAVRERMRIESVWLAYGDSWVVRDVTLPVRQGEVLALIGASGSGKTTLLRSLNRLTEVTAGAARAGRITLDGQEIHDLEVNDLRR
jgi:phosphate transport system ATP-binding protein